MDREMAYEVHIHSWLLLPGILFVVVVLLCFAFQDRISLHNRALAVLDSVVQAGLELRDLPASAS